MLCNNARPSKDILVVDATGKPPSIIYHPNNAVIAYAQDSPIAGYLAVPFGLVSPMYESSGSKRDES